MFSTTNPAKDTIASMIRSVLICYCVLMPLTLSSILLKDVFLCIGDYIPEPLTDASKKEQIFFMFLLDSSSIFCYYTNRVKQTTYARVAQWWSVSLPRRRSRVRSPSRASFIAILFYTKSCYQNMF